MEPTMTSQPAGKKHISAWIWFGGGVVLGLAFGVAAVGLVATQIFTELTSVNPDEGAPFIGSIVHDVRSRVIKNEEQTESTTLYGEVLESSATGMVVLTRVQDEEITYTLQFTGATEFVELARDDDSTPIPFSPTEILVGEKLQVETVEPLGSAQTLTVVSVTRF